MDQQKHQLELIERARRGDRQSLDELATLYGSEGTGLEPSDHILRLRMFYSFN